MSSSLPLPQNQTYGERVMWFNSKQNARIEALERQNAELWDAILSLNLVAKELTGCIARQSDALRRWNGLVVSEDQVKKVWQTSAPKE